jgi:hypothetical protein
MLSDLNEKSRYLLAISQKKVVRIKQSVMAFAK